MAIEISFTAGFVLVAFLFGYVLGLAKSKTSQTKEKDARNQRTSKQP